MGSIGGLSPGGSIAIGIIVGLLSTSVQSLGLTLQRKSHILEDEKGPHDIRRPPHRRLRWQLGMGMFVVSNILGSSVQISTLPLPVLSTLQAAGLVFNSICATLILGEPFTRWSLAGTVLVCGGAILIAIFGAIPSPAHSLSELLDLLGRGPFIIWMSLQAVLVVAIAVMTDMIDRLGNWSQSLRWRFARGLAYGCISGILSAHSLLFAKSAVELILRTISDNENQFVHWQSWMLVLGLVTLALTQLYYLHRGLKLVSTSVLYPLVFCIYNIIAILDGLIYFDQTDLITPLRGGLIALGTVILLSGVLALSWRLSDEQHPPAPGQSALAPGLGLVEDTDGEDEVESLLDSDTLTDDGRSAPAPYTSYDTFVPRGEEPEPLVSGLPKPVDRWRERDEIWGELEDHNGSMPSSAPLLVSRSRSSTLPAGEATALLGSRRGGNDSASSLAGASVSGEGSRRLWRRRRKSTGFPGFTARKNPRRTASGVQDPLGGIWKLKWFRGGHPDAGEDESVIVTSPESSANFGRASTQSPVRFRDEVDVIDDDADSEAASARRDRRRQRDAGDRPSSGATSGDAV